jgi:hypothetical protein
MEPEKSLDYSLVLADLESKLAEQEAKCAELRAAIAAVQRIMGYADVPINAPIVAALVPVTPAPAQATNGQTDAIPEDAFFAMNMASAAVKYLRIVKKKKSTKEIALALERGGFAHESKNFYVTLWNVLNRESKNEGSEIIKVKTFWALAEWYPDRQKK